MTVEVLYLSVSRSVAQKPCSDGPKAVAAPYGIIRIGRSLSGYFDLLSYNYNVRVGNGIGLGKSNVVRAVFTCDLGECVP